MAVDLNMAAARQISEHLGPPPPLPESLQDPEKRAEVVQRVNGELVWFADLVIGDVQVPAEGTAGKRLRLHLADRAAGVASAARTRQRHASTLSRRPSTQSPRLTLSTPLALKPPQRSSGVRGSPTSSTGCLRTLTLSATPASDLAGKLTESLTDDPPRRPPTRPYGQAIARRMFLEFRWRALAA
jgi:hypothetical protein